MRTTLIIRNLDVNVMQKLRMLAASHGRSMEAEARAILTERVKQGTNPALLMKGKFDHLVGCWKGRMTTDEVMELNRSDEIDQAYSGPPNG